MDGPRKSHTTVTSKTPAISNAVAYTAGDVVGDLMKLTNAAGDYCAAVIQSICVKDKSNQKAALTLLFFREAPTGIPADNAPFALSSADADKCVGKANIAAADYETLDTTAIALNYPGLVVTGHQPSGRDEDAPQSAGDLWMVAVTTGTPTYTGVAKLSFEVGTLKD